MKDTTTSHLVADQIVDMLAEGGIRHIYAITGDSLNALTDAIGRDGRIRFIHMRHEESGAFAASAEAQLTGSLACCAGSSGPGHVHLINGLYDAKRANAPVLAIASTCGSAVLGTGYFQETNPTLLFSDCSVYNQMSVTPEQLPHMMQAAMQEAISLSGVSVIGLPADVISLPAQPSQASCAPLTTGHLPEPTESEIHQCADILNAARSVTIFAGAGCAGATDALRALSDKLNAPVVTTFKSQMELMGHCPNYIGHLGYLGTWAAIDAVRDADAIIMIGMNFPFPGFFPTDKKIIQIDIRAERIGRIARVDAGIRADAKIFLETLLPAINQKTDRKFLDNALQQYSQICHKLAQPVSNPGTNDCIRPEYVFATLDRLADDDCIFTVDTGMNCLWSAHYLTPATGRSMIGSFTHGSMANAMPQSIGAAIACPDRQVIALCGDGGLTMLLGDLLTIVQYQLPIKILVADNRSLAYVKWEMALAGFTPSEVDLHNPDFGEMARSMGFTAETVRNPRQLEDAMRRWLSAQGPALLSVVTDQDAASFSFSKEMMESATPDSVTENFIAPGTI